MQTSKQVPPQHKSDSDDGITIPKISRTLWEPSSLEKIERISNVEEQPYEIQQNQIDVFINEVENLREVFKGIFVPMKVHNLKVLKEFGFRQRNGRGHYLARNKKPIAYSKTLGTSIVSQFKHLQKLHLNFGPHLEGEDLQEFGIQIARNLSNLRCLKVDFNSPYMPNVKYLRMFIREICKNLSNLKKVRFYLHTFEGMTGEVLRGLIHNICRYLRELEHFSFRCPSHGIKDEDIEKFLLELDPSFPKLEALELNFEDVMEFGSKSRQRLNYLLRHHFKGLKSLSLSFGSSRNYSRSESSCDDYEKMFRDVTIRLDDLQKLKLRLQGILINGVKNITKYVFESLSKLTHFSLYVDDRIKDQGLKDISSAFKLKRNPLQKIKIEIGRSQVISNEGFDILMSGIANHLPELKKLELNFSDCKKIGSSALRSLALKVIKPSVMLKNLKLNFSRCRSIKGKGLEELLIEIVNRQESLESVNLVLEHIGDFGKSEDKINELLASCPLIKWKINNNPVIL